MVKKRVERVCAWCRKSLGTAFWGGDPRYPVTHGVCPECAARLTAPVPGPSWKQFLDGLGAPVLLVDDDLRIAAANDLACGLLGKTSEGLVGRPCGDIIECSYASNPDGCGGSVHCRTCTIRNSVRETFETGEPLIDVPAYPDSHLFRADKDTSLRISTEKVGACVLLRIRTVGKR